MNRIQHPENLSDYVDGSLALAASRAVEAHLATCAACRSEVESLRRLHLATAALPREISPVRDLWPAIARQLHAAHAAPASPSITSFPAAAFRWLVPLAVAAAIALLCTIAARRPIPARPGDLDAWSVATMTGTPRIAARAIRDSAPFRVGQWLETDSRSTAKVAVASIGEVRVEPNSRVRLVGTTAHEHRIELARGTVDALIWAPPRLFFVDTPSATAIDLGCAYTLAVDDHGDGELHVTAGYVALEHGDRESIIPSGLKCLTRRGAGPGTPFAADAPLALRAALEAFDFGPAAGRGKALDALLAHARANDTVTLWHLLARTDGPQRAAAFDTLARHSAPPEGVTRTGILAGDAAMRHLWAAALGLGTFE